MTDLAGVPVIELLSVHDCPRVAPVRRRLCRVLRQLGVTAQVVEHVGSFPSPTVLVDGRDVVTGRRLQGGGPSCRLDLPTAGQLRSAISLARRP